MKSTLALSTAASALAAATATVGSLLLIPSPTLAFAPSSSLHSTSSTIVPNRIKPTSLSSRYMSDTKESPPPVDEKESTIVDDGGAWNIGTPSRQLLEADRKKQVAKDALNKLLQRQQRDVQQTLDLLENLAEVIDHEEAYENNDFNATSFLTTNNNETTTTTTLSSITASVAAGADYGFISRSEGCRTESIGSNYILTTDDARFEEYGPPGSIFTLGSQQFMRNLRAMIGEYTDEEDNPKLTPKQRELQSKLEELTLSSEAIWDRERARGEVVAPWIIKIPYFVLCYFLDVVFEGRNSFSRFFLLETVARMPYFSYITMLHLYETLGFWRRSADIKRIHFAEEWNEFHHLLIMESLGGDQPYWVRFMAQHSALAYYLALCILWMMSPSLSYKFSEMLETHAVDTYSQFVDENADKLKKLPPSLVAVEYYTVGVSDPMFGEYQTASVSNPERGGVVRKAGTNMRTLYDVFVAIRNDEGDHVQTMTSCLDPKVATMSPGLESRLLTGVALAAGASLVFGGGAIDNLNGISESLGGLTGVESMGVEGLSDMADGVPDLDSILLDDGGTSGVMNAVVGGLASLDRGLEGIVGAEGVEIDDDVTGSALEDLAAGGMDGFELDAIIELAKSIIVGILKVLPFV
eukprot:CAMPEP_0196131836 /NCGR_PEP_ID=MMETSP0910-20130528/1674_1 /TAXON_ID=49265 /ORGANISM="Thalassiosira rotula, Strain GSO102" /LENGTH=637 /DNA_ID=CAMNT_0041391349 /DNA_START=317 /DNA_END=2230 /DNA_ORIENTATION=+